jgi:hypothetical protein
MKELESPICEAVRRVAEQDAHEYVEVADQNPWFHPPKQVHGDEPLTVDAEQIAQAT